MDDVVGVVVVHRDLVEDHVALGLDIVGVQQRVGDHVAEHVDRERQVVVEHPRVEAGVLLGGEGVELPADGVEGHLINPEWNALDDTEQFGPEGCLSIPGLRADCRRYDHVVARGWDMHGEPQEIEGTALLARAVQHETDHLDGVLFVDRLDEETRKLAMKAIREAEWFGAAPPTVKLSPHPIMKGLGT